MESFGSTNIPNRIIDLVLIGRPDLVDVERIICSCAEKKLHRKLKYRLNKITQFFESRSDLPIICIAYRGELSLKGRFPGDDIDMLVSCESESDYSTVKYEILNVARKLKFKEVDWIEMYLDQPNQKKNVIFYNEEGIFRLDCYVTVGEQELLRIQNESRHEALWVIGVLSHSKPIINHEYFKNYLDRFEVEVRKFHKIPE